ncbi:hypothetical protein [Chelativorans sp.]|uniref:hypothetical protein n=1 Tax=Chelativorans sp. TaxID=2203393 RepID=UPI002810B62B|nr:hypothetical protein [Chelativorans sp.]
MTQVVYSTQPVPNMEGRTFKNPRSFLAPVKGATKVYLNGDWPAVKAAYEQIGVPVADVSEMRALPKTRAEEQK